MRARGGRAVGRVLVAVGLTCGVLGPAGSPAQAAQTPCAPTRPDAVGPFYVPNAPVRSVVGRGHVLQGTVRSTAGCSAIAGARVEIWLAGPTGQYDEAHRATVITDRDGAYRFESTLPGAYGGRPPHIHVRATARGFEPLVTQYYPAPREAEGTFDLVLIPSG